MTIEKKLLTEPTLKKIQTAENLEEAISTVPILDCISEFIVDYLLGDCSNYEIDYVKLKHGQLELHLTGQVDVKYGKWRRHKPTEVTVQVNANESIVKMGHIGNHQILNVRANVKYPTLNLRYYGVLPGPTLNCEYVKDPNEPIENYSFR
ncbi:hypothetical protein JXB41_00535 [Candidatus Woesearchaeota archaeon]|nr:hypothetical protein [Candidatus Woesearchaeota archaeon]